MSAPRGEALGACLLLPEVGGVALTTFLCTLQPPCAAAPSPPRPLLLVRTSLGERVCARTCVRARALGVCPSAPRRPALARRVRAPRF